ncbi:MAG: hypothetical protein E7618_03180 [Ruminococcaceae bacterium]|nr:hypothetical protein [Oscillospiraceae bacterium]
MNKMLLKLIAASLTLVIAVVMVTTMTYAWTTLSSAPVAEGLQITIGGGNTILIAPDRTQTVDGKTYHYPGHFSEQLNFSHYDEYDYLNSLAALRPVSTADGVNWFLPEFYDVSDPEVLNGEASVGELKPPSGFTRDTTLAYANRTEPTDKGHYLYLDFWVVSPGTDYTLRMSAGDENGGSFLLELMKAVDNGDGTYSLTETEGHVAASARIGFLTNADPVEDMTMLLYQQSPLFSSRFSTLRGRFTDEGDVWFSTSNRFTIYEPNGDLHPNSTNGTYTVTTPLGLAGNAVTALDIRDRLSVSLTHRWKQTDVRLEDIFTVALAGKTVSSAAEAEEILYHRYLQGQVMPYVERASFFKNTAALYSYCAHNGTADAAALGQLSLAGATEDVYIVELEKNIPQRIRMFVWIEGQDVDCSYDAQAVSFALSMELAGSH